MGLIGNNVRLSQNPMIVSGGANVLTINPDGRAQPGAQYGFSDGEGTGIGVGSHVVVDTAGIPNGYLSPRSLLLPNKSGGMSAYRRGDFALVDGLLTLSAGQNITANGTLSLNGSAIGTAVIFVTASGSLSLTGTASIIGALAGTGTASLTLNGDISAMVGKLPGSGAATLSLNLNAAVANLALSGTGTATLSLNGGTAAYELIAQLTANGTLTLLGLPSAITGALLATGNATMLLSGGVVVTGGFGFLTGTGILGLTGSLAPGGVGHMTGSTEGNAVLTAESIAAAVWNALVATYQGAGSFGEAIANGSAGLTQQQIRDAMALAASGGSAAGSVDAKLDALPTAAANANAVHQRAVEGPLTLEQCIRILMSFPAGDGTIPDGPGSFAFKSRDGATVRIAGTIDDSGNRIITGVDGT